MNTSTGVTVTDLTKAYDGNVVLHGVNLQVSRGSIAAIVGASGCGKTTLLRCVAGFETPQSGQIVIDDDVVCGSRWVPAHRRGVGYVAQDGALFPHLSVAQNIGFGLPRKDRTKERIGSLLETVELTEDFGRRRPDQLSGGQQQRVSLARALALRPRVMLLDEPFSALDTGLRERTRQIVGAALREAGITTILVTHDHEEALSFADQVAVMSSGRFRQVGSPSDVYLRPTDVDTARFLGETIELSAVAGSGLASCCLGKVTVDPAMDGVVNVLLRPEQVQVTRATDPTGCRVVGVDFRGDHVRLQVTVPGEPTPVTLRASSLQPPAVGDDVQITIIGAATACNRTD